MTHLHLLFLTATLTLTAFACDEGPLPSDDDAAHHADSSGADAYSDISADALAAPDVPVRIRSSSQRPIVHSRQRTRPTSTRLSSVNPTSVSPKAKTSNNAKSAISFTVPSAVPSQVAVRPGTSTTLHPLVHASILRQVTDASAVPKGESMTGMQGSVPTTSPHVGRAADEPQARDDAGDAELGMTLSDGAWIGLMVDGRPMVTSDGEAGWFQHERARWTRHGKVAHAPPTVAALTGPLSGWVGRRLVGVDTRGRTCEGTVTGLLGRAEVFRSNKAYPGMPDERRKTASEMITKATSLAVLADVSWSSRCAKRVVLVRPKGAAVPVIYSETDVKDEDRHIVSAAFRWSKAWEREQARYIKAIGTDQRHRLIYERTWDHAGPTIKRYRSPDGQIQFVAQAAKGGECGDPGGALGLRFNWLSGQPPMPLTDYNGTPTLEGEVASYRTPGFLARIPGSEEWIGGDAHKRLEHFGDDAEAVHVPADDLFIRMGCGC